MYSLAYADMGNSYRSGVAARLSLREGVTFTPGDKVVFHAMHI